MPGEIIGAETGAKKAGAKRAKAPSERKQIAVGMGQSRWKTFGVMLGAGSILGLSAYGVTSIFRSANQTFQEAQQQHHNIQPWQLAELLRPSIDQGDFPRQIHWPRADVKIPVYLDYTLDHELQHEIDRLLAYYKPDFGTVAAMDAQSGELLALASFRRDGHDGHLGIISRFPAASLAKIITAAAAIDQQGMLATSQISYNGGNHTLYKKNVYSDSHNRWTRSVSLKDAFGKSINSVFGKLGLFHLGREPLEQYAEKFGFNRAIVTDIPMESARFFLPDADDWAVVEAASGYNRRTLMGPVQGAMMAAAVSNRGVLVDPYMVRAAVSSEGESLYQPLPRPSLRVMQSPAAEEMKKLMEATVRSGTSRKAFRDFLRRFNEKDVEVGGKTGSLTGDEIEGKHDWFSGYLKIPNRVFAISVLTIHEKNWRVKSSTMAQDLFRYIIKRDVPELNAPAKNRRESKTGRRDFEKKSQRAANGKAKSKSQASKARATTRQRASRVQAR